jgi:hypothetical protein
MALSSTFGGMYGKSVTEEPLTMKENLSKKWSILQEKNFSSFSWRHTPRGSSLSSLCVVHFFGWRRVVFPFKKYLFFLSFFLRVVRRVVFPVSFLFSLSSC